MNVWDLHCDTLSALRRAEQAGRPLSFVRNDLHIDLEKLEAGDYMLQCFAAFVDLGSGEDPLVTALEEIDVFKRLMAAYPDRIAPVYAAGDIARNAAAGKISAMLTVEEGGCCKGSLGVLRRLYELGVRMMTLTWNYDNDLAASNVKEKGPFLWPCPPDAEHGLTEKGLAFLAEMERLHMIADVSHLSDRGFWDLVEHSTRPFAASHSNCRALAPHCRNLTDEMIRAMAERGCIAGLNYCTAFLGLPQHGGADRPARGPLQAGGRRRNDRPRQRFRRHRRPAGTGQLRQTAPAGRCAAPCRLHRGRGGGHLLAQRTEIF